MTYHVGSVEEGEQPSNVINVGFGRKANDGGKARIKAKRETSGLSTPTTPPPTNPS